MTFCAQCGKQLGATDLFCSSCGTRVNRSSFTAVAPPIAEPAPAAVELAAPPTPEPSPPPEPAAAADKQTPIWVQIMQLIGIVLAIRLFGILGGGLTIATYIVAKRKLGTPTAAVIAAAVGLIVAIVANAVLRAST